ncbi:hypothetical protein F2Q68_00033641 [Brassica cretica]|uniref:Uncharacterized protein n=1 Tax=Brassica cretica TaxID=69181 RepID=A0A8S9H034_BRACR|nr:hypothetical protein F2Q68_00033641 [Brassica cretica]
MNSYLPAGPDTCLSILASCDRYPQELHRRIRYLAMYGDLPAVRLIPSFYTCYIFELAFKCHRCEVHQHPVAEIMFALLKSGQSVSREEAVEEMKGNRSMVKLWHRSTVFPE